MGWTPKLKLIAAELITQVEKRAWSID